MQLSSQVLVRGPSGELVQIPSTPPSPVGDSPELSDSLCFCEDPQWGKHPYYYGSAVNRVRARGSGDRNRAERGYRPYHHPPAVPVSTRRQL